MRPELYDSDYALSELGSLIYRDCIQNVLPLLEPAVPIADPNLIIGKVGQQNLLPSHFSLRPKDLEYMTIKDSEGKCMGDPIPPGISTFIFFGSQQSNQHCLDSLVNNYLYRQLDRKNRFYIAQVKDIQEAGWIPYYAPLLHKNEYNPLHIILVPNSIQTRSTFKDAYEVEKINISQAFVRWNW